MNVRDADFWLLVCGFIAILGCLMYAVQNAVFEAQKRARAAEAAARRRRDRNPANAVNRLRRGDG